MHENIKTHKCDFCERSFGKRFQLKNHLLSFHPEHHEIVEKRNLLGHNEDNIKKNLTIQSYNISKMEEYTCNICGKIFELKSYLNKHIKLAHNHEKQFQCHICEQMFVQITSLKTHVKVVHEKVKSGKCEICGQNFGQKQSMKIHMRTVHGNLKRKKKYICKVM